MVLDVANEFNLPLCRLKLNTLLNMPLESSESVIDAVVEALLEANTSSKGSCLRLWTQIVSGCRPLHGQEVNIPLVLFRFDFAGVANGA